MGWRSRQENSSGVGALRRPLASSVCVGIMITFSVSPTLCLLFVHMALTVATD